MAKPGPLNTIADVPGLRVGSAHDARVRTGVTVILPDTPAVCAVDVRGGAPGTRETDALAPDALVDAVDALVLSGGSVYGLAAADGVVAALGAAGKGFALNPAATVRSPVVPAAILYDLANGGDKDWGEDPPYRRLGRAALEAASRAVGLGAVGAGAGATAGGLQGGQGAASVIAEDGCAVGALAVVNCFGSTLIPGSRAFWAWPFEQAGEFGAVAPPAAPFGDLEDWIAAKLAARAQTHTNTNLCLVATDAALTPAQAKRVASMASAGLARAVRPVYAPFDGDIVFALSTAARPLAAPAPFTIAKLGALAADCLARAVARGVYEARAWPGGRAWRDLD
jgi:L-aminopeptidase/D-esterase-like protein